MSKITIDRATLQQALDVLESNRKYVSRVSLPVYIHNVYDPLIADLEEALAQPAQPTLTDEHIQDLLKCGNPTDEQIKLIHMGWRAAINKATGGTQ